MNDIEFLESRVKNLEEIIDKIMVVLEKLSKYQVEANKHMKIIDEILLSSGK